MKDQLLALKEKLKKPRRCYDSDILNICKAINILIDIVTEEKPVVEEKPKKSKKQEENV